ncbi:MAG: FAD-dependent oxidoreductase [Bacilli bacterium]|nr:FAD-dependent oxidoreductase [Bacilli bacterium]
MYNTIVIGAGPAGMSAALYLKRAGISVLIIDKDAPGGQLLKTSNVENYLGFSSINGADLALEMFDHIKKNSILFEFGEVKSVVKSDGYIVKLSDKEFNCKNIIIATGRKPLKLGLGEDNLRGISYCAVCDGTFYRDKVVGVVGGGDSAFTNALYLSDLCEKVYIFVRSKVRASVELINRAKECKNIVIIEGNNISELQSNDEILNKVILSNGKEFMVDGLFIAIGGKPNFDFISGVDTVDGYIKVNDKMETSLENIYACGDVIKKDVYQIVTAVSEGAVAALSIKSGGE